MSSVPERQDDARTDTTDRPVVAVGSELGQVVREAAAALSRDPEVYERQGRLCWVPRAPQAGGPDAPPEIFEMSLAALRTRLSDVAVWKKFDGRTGQLRPCAPPQRVALSVLEHRDWPGVRLLVGITETPVFRRDGTILQVPGYDDATGYLYRPSTVYPPIPERPTQHDAMRGLRELCEIYEDFPFAHGADRYVPIAALLTVLGRSTIQGACPAFVFDGKAPGCGKTSLVDSIATLVNARLTRPVRWPKTEAMRVRVIKTTALAGQPLLVFDNVGRPLNSAALSSIITAPDGHTINIRRANRRVYAPWRTVVLATGNNVVVQAELRRRVLVARLEPLEDRTSFRHPNLLAWVGEHRARLVASALTILRAYALAKEDGGVSEAPGTWGSFEDWYRRIPPAIVWAGGANVLDARLAGREPDERRGAMAQPAA